ncbi:CHAT domain-containing WD40 repeat protein [Streptomyces bambusae]|uniref:CHAT domain-containing protein n=1 Tax=Streptomyces bambusae TaxID=1550616 RepID=A0ABS6Z6B7_9ACTN|nr:CHAT domain-containing protein [Streptomyces bambusae]MBW5483287.1 CHAT domain-containing protein [Streptomyces bambusae]
MKGLPFRLEIIEADTSWVVLCSSECGEATVRVPAPYSGEELRAVLAEVETALTRSFSSVVTRRSAQTERPVREFGERLTGAVLRDEILIQFDRCRSRARAEDRPLRVLIGANGPRVERIPWEYLVDPAGRDDYLSLRVPVVRNLRLMNPAPPLSLTLPLRVLGISARPRDLPVLDEQREREHIARVLQEKSSDNVDVHWLPGDRWEDLRDALRFGTWHVLHCVCHGGFDEEQNTGFLELSRDDGSARPVYARDFERLILDGTQLRLIVLNACESAVSGADDVFTSTAANLIRAGVPAVVAMQYEITDQAAFTFASSFYEHVAQGLPVDRAVTFARQDVKMSLGSLEWATPVLFLADRTRIFSVPKGQQEEPPDAPVDLRKRDRDVPPGEEPGTSAAPPPRPHPATAPSEPGLPAPRRTGVLAELGWCDHVALGPRNLLAAACGDGLVRVLDASTGLTVARCTLANCARPVQLAWGPWRRHVASRHEDGKIVVWDLQTEVPARLLNVGPGSGASLAFSGDGHWLAVAVGEHVHVYDANGAQVRDIPVAQGRKAGAWQSGVHGRLGPLAFAPDGRHLVVAGTDGVVRQLDVRGRQVAEWQHPQPVHALAVTPGVVATGCADGRVRVWSWAGRLLRSTPHGPEPTHLALSADASVLAVSDIEGLITLWDLRSGRTTAPAEGSGRPSVGIAFLEGGQGLVASTRQGAVEHWTLPDWMAAPGGDA